MRGMSGKREGHVAFVAVAEVGTDIGGPLIRLRQQRLPAVALIELVPEQLEDGVSLGQVLVDGALALNQVGNRVEPQRIDPRSSQNRMMSRISPSTSGLSRFKSGWCEKKRCQCIICDRIVGPVRFLPCP